MWPNSQQIYGRSAAVVRSFGNISADNRRIITMEWVAEGLALTFVGALILIVTLAAGLADPVAVLVYRLLAGVSSRSGH